MNDNESIVSLGIPVYDDHRNLVLFLEALCTQSLKRFEVVIIEGGDINKTREIVEPYRKSLNIRLYRQNGEGLASARNEAWSKAKGQIVVFADADVRPTPNWLKELIATFSTNDGIGGVCGPSFVPKEFVNKRDLTKFLTYNRSRSIVSRIVRNLYFGIFLENSPYSINRFFRSGAYSIGSMIPEVVMELRSPVVVDYLDACNMCFRKSVLVQTKGFDLAFDGLGEYSEPDLCFRIREMGNELMLNPKAIVFHCPDSELFVTAEKMRSRGRNFGKFIKEYFFKSRSLRTILYVSFFNAYHFHKSIKERNLAWLHCLTGFITGVTR